MVLEIVRPDLKIDGVYPDVSRSDSSNDRKLVKDYRIILDQESNATTAEESIPSYRDFSRVLPKQSEHLTKSPSTNIRSQKKNKFPKKLHSILSNPKFGKIITWIPHGRAWKVLQPKAFEQLVLPLYFSHGKYSSFIRQVHGWGFRRITHNQYYHEMFLRGMPHLCDDMNRLTKQAIALRKKEGIQISPGFYKFCNKNPMPRTNSASTSFEKKCLPSFEKISGDVGHAKRNKLESWSVPIQTSQLLGQVQGSTSRDKLIAARELRLHLVRRRRMQLNDKTAAALAMKQL